MKVIRMQPVKNDAYQSVSRKATVRLSSDHGVATGGLQFSLTFLKA